MDHGDIVREGVDVGVALTASGLFALMAVLAHSFGPSSVDLASWRGRVFGRPSRRTRRRIERFSRALAPVAFGAAGATAAALLEKDGRQEAAETMVATSAVAALADHALKAPFRRRRPPESWFTRGSDASFPSGHSMAACAVPTVLAYTLARERLLPTPAAIAVASVPPFAVGAMRLLVRKHWLTDVVAGWAAGLAVAGAAAAWYELRRRM